MAIIARSERSEGINPTPLRAGDTGAGLVGDAVQRAGNALNSFAVTMAKEREDLDQFETKMALQKFHNDQTRRQVEYDDGIQGDGREHTAGRIAEYDQARDGLIKTLPKNERSRKMAMLQTENWRGDFGMRSLNAQRSHINTYKETELLNQTVIGVVPGVTGDRATVEPALKQLDTMVNGSGLPEGRRNAIRANAVGLIVERFIEQGDITSRMQADNIIKEYQERLAKEPKEAAPAADDDFGGVAVHPGLKTGDGRRSIEGLSPPFRTGISAMFRDMPPELRAAVEINEATRSNEYQAELHEKYRSGRGGIAAPPGKSRHNHGEAIDLSPPAGDWKNKSPEYKAALEWIYANGSRYGIHNPDGLRTKDPHHFELMPGARNSAAGGDLQFRGTETAQHTNGRGESSDVEIRLGRSDGLFVRGLIHNLDKIDKRVAKLQEQDSAARFVQSVAVDGYPFNPHDDVGRKKVDKAFENSALSERLFAGERDALNQAVLVSQSLNYVPKTVSEALHGMIKSANAGKREVGLLAAASILDVRPFAFDATPGSEAVKKDALDFTALVRAQGLSAEMALKRLDEFNSPQWAKLESERGKTAKEKAAALTETDLRKEFNASPWFWSRPGLQYVGNLNVIMMADARKAFIEHWTRTGEDKLAMQLAVGELSRVWGVTEATGTQTLMRNPPESLPQYAPVGMSKKWIQDDLLLTVNDWLKANGKDAVKMGDLSERLSIVADAKTDTEIKRSPASGVEQRPPSYTLWWKNDRGSREPVMSMGADGTLKNRWHGDYYAAVDRWEKEFAGERKKRMEGKTATNPATGEMQQYRDGGWQKVNPADLDTVHTAAPKYTREQSGRSGYLERRPLIEDAADAYKKGREAEEKRKADRKLPPTRLKLRWPDTGRKQEPSQ